MNKYVICLNNETNPESLIIGKVYLSLPDDEAAEAGLIRVLDETFGEAGSQDGYLYLETMFAPIILPKAAEQVLEQVYA